MTSPAPSTDATASRISVWGEWIVVLGLAATLGWTTLSLGGYLAATMLVTAWSIFGLAALGGVLWALGREPGTRQFNLATWLPVPFLLFALASVLWLAPARWLAWREWLLWLQMWLVFAVALHFGRGKGRASVLAGALVCLALVGVALAAYQRYFDRTWLMLGLTQAEQYAGRSSGMFGSPNSLAGLFELLIPLGLTLSFSRTTGRLVRIAGGWLAGVLIFGIVLTGSRGGWISLGLALLAGPLLGRRDWRQRLAGAVLVLALAVVGLASLYRFSENAHARIQPFLEGRFEASRPIIWKVGLQIWRGHPWLGGGASSYNVLFDQFRPRGFLNEPRWAHNDYLNTLSDYGVLGFGLWLGAGICLLGLGWRAVKRARQENVSTGGTWASGAARLGLFLGLLAFDLHLAVDFHTKSPALAMAAAMITALLLRDEPGLISSVPGLGARAVGLAVALSSMAMAGGLATPLYRAEALRYESRRAIDRLAASGRGTLGEIIPAALGNLAHAVRLDSTNGQAWADLSYATVQGWNVEHRDLEGIGLRAGQAAERALAICSIKAEFWVRKGVALDMQNRQKEGENCFQRAVQLAPNNPDSWFYYAYHLRSFPERKTEALQAVDTCLALDPSFSVGVALRQQLVAGR